MYWLGRALQMAGISGVGLVLVLNLWPEGITMSTMLLLVGFSVLMFIIGTTLLRAGGD